MKRELKKFGIYLMIVIPIIVSQPFLSSVGTWKEIVGALLLLPSVIIIDKLADSYLK